jgi:hypothetical protein
MFKRIRRWFRRPSNPAGNVYYVKLSTLQGVFYKIGYTTKLNLMERFSYGDFGDERLVSHQFLFAFHETAWDVEQELLDYFDKHRAFGKYSNDPMSPLPGRGQSELFRHDVLGLDEDLYRSLDDLRETDAEGSVKQSNEGCFMVLVGLALAPFTIGLSLLFVFGGFSGILEFGKNKVPTMKRPVHPSKIKNLINDLRQRAHAV